MNKIKVIIIFLLCLIIFFNCEKKNIVKEVQTSSELKKVDFIPPQDSSITINQMKKWLLCNALLDSLSLIYKDSFALNDASKQLIFQENFRKAQDIICVKAGLSGGYEEYLWIIKNIGVPKNKVILDSLKLTAYK